MMLLRAVLLGAALALPLTPPVWAEDKVIQYSDNDPAMQAAIREAKATLPLFLVNALNADGMSVDGALVKVEFPTVPGSGMGGEYIWVSPFARLPQGGFSGYLANEPLYLGDVRQGDSMEFSEAMISDWHLTGHSGRYFGSFTSRVMHAAGAFGDTPFEQVFELPPLPADWH